MQEMSKEEWEATIFPTCEYKSSVLSFPLFIIPPLCAIKKDDEGDNMWCSSFCPLRNKEESDGCQDI